MDKIIIETGDFEVDFPTVTEVVEISSDHGTIEIHSGQEVNPEIIAFAVGPRGERGLPGRDGEMTDELALARDEANLAAQEAKAAAGDAESSAASALTQKKLSASSATSSANSKVAAEAAAEVALASEAKAKTSETSAAASAIAVENARTDVLAAKTAVETARNQAQAAKTSSETAKGLAESARDAAQTAEDGAEKALADAVVQRQAAEGFAANARASAEMASQFDPSSYPMKQNNGADFADPSAVLDNIGGQAKLDVPDQAEAEAGTSTVVRGWTAQRIRQAIEALATAAVHRHEVSDIDGLQDVLDGLFVNAVFTGTTSVPTAAVGDSSTAIANTEFVRTALDAIIDAAPGTMDTLNEIAAALGDDPNFAATITQQLAGKADKVHAHAMSEITGLADALGLLAPLTSPAFAGTPTAPSKVASDSSNAIATTKHVKDAIAASGLSVEGHKHVAADITDLQGLLDQRSLVGHKHVAADITDLAALLAAKAARASPTFTGTVTVPTPAVNDNSTKAASTAFVVTALNNGLAGKSNTGHAHAITDITGLQSALDAKAPLASPAFTGNPTATTQDAGNNSTRIATTAFVTGAVAAAVADKADKGHSHDIVDIAGLQAALAGKLDLTGGELTGKLYGIRPEFAGMASFNFPPGVTPTAVENGDVWMVGVGMVMRRSNANYVVWDSGNLGSIGQPEAEAGVGVTSRAWTAQRVRQAILAAPVGTETQTALDLKANLSGPTFTGPVNVTGDIIASGNINAYSDARLKTDVKQIADALEMVSQIRGVRFTMNGEPGLGVIAQEVQAVAPELVAENENGMLSVAYGNIAGILIEAIKELRAEVEELRSAA